MRSIHYDVHRRGGVATTAELLGDGHTSHQLTNAVRRGEILRVRQGHYACTELADDQVRAYRVGGRLGGISGAAAHGIWVPRSTALDVIVPANARALRSQTDATIRLRPGPRTRVRWSDHLNPGTRSLAGPTDCLVGLLLHCSPRDGFAAAESALHGGIISPSEWTRVVAVLPRAVARSFERVSRRSESGGESLLLFDLRSTGIEPLQQIDLPGVGRVDFIIGERLIVEVDGAEFHTDRRDFEEDRRRDAVASTLGFRVLRFSHAQVERRDPVVLAAIRAAIARGDHR